MEVEDSSVKKEGGDGSGGGGKRPRGEGPTPAGSPTKKGKKEEVGRRCISISWLYTRSHSLVLQLLRLQLFDDGFITDDDAAPSLLQWIHTVPWPRSSGSWFATRGVWCGST